MENLPEYLDWCVLCHGDGYFRRESGKQGLWRVRCSTKGCRSMTDALDAIGAARMWNARLGGDCEMIALNVNLKFERDVARESGVEVFRHRRELATPSKGAVKLPCERDYRGD